MVKLSESLFDPDARFETIASILDALDALVYVSDMETYEMLYMNHYGIERWGEPNGNKCWQVLQDGQSGPCQFCTNDRLIKKDGNAADVYVWEFQNTVNNRWYQCRDQAIPWIDGRLVRLEIATDISDRVEAEGKLENTKNEALKMARTDALTGVKNRRALFEEAENIFNLAHRYNHTASVIIIDMDHFKNVNDAHGHSAGDEVLISLAGLISQNVRKVDIFARFGGEEFALVLPETDILTARETAEKLRKLIEDMKVDTGKAQINITSSFGVAELTNSNSNFGEVLSNADKALYIAKKKGRNCVECYSE